MSSNEVRFSVDARLVTELGEQLVPSDHMALAELVKNAYDADATEVVVEYSSEPSTLVVEDNGSGMSMDQLVNGWFRLGTHMKEKESVSEGYGRVRVGRKGVGRFAAQRLSERMTLVTGTSSKQPPLQIEFDWSDFLSNRDIGDIPFHVQSNGGPACSGTRLVFTGLRRQWTRGDFEVVRDQLLNLRAPLSERHPRSSKSHDPGFELSLKYCGEDMRPTDETIALRDARVVRVIGTVDETGVATVTFEVKQPRVRDVHVDDYFDRVRTGPLRFELDLFVLLRKYIGEFGVRKATQVLKEHGGVRVWRDGFRVFPFGERNDDWLGLDAHVAARRPPLNMWRNQQVLGGVFITQEENPQLIDLVTRRGLVENDAYRDLVALIQWAVERAAGYHKAALPAKSDQRQKSEDVVTQTVAAMRDARLKHAKRLDAALAKAESGDQITAATKNRLQAAQKQSEAELTRLEDRLLEQAQARDKRVLDEMSTLRVLSSLGAGLATFAHETRMVTAPLLAIVAELEGLDTTNPPTEERLASLASRMRKAIEELEAYRGYIDGFVTADAVRQSRLIEVGPFIAQLLDSLRPLFARNTIEVVRRLPDNIFIGPAHPAELNSVLFNLITNAVKALKSPSVTSRKLQVALAAKDGIVQVLVGDTGPGVRDDLGDDIFKPFVTFAHSAEERELGQGTGLGLFIARRIAEGLGGKLEFIGARKSYNAVFSFELPER